MAGFPGDAAVHAREQGYRGQSGFAGSAAVSQAFPVIYEYNASILLIYLQCGFCKKLSETTAEQGRTERAGYAPTSMMPNHVKFAARAGDCCVFDLATWHTAQPNRSQLERWNTIQVGSGAGTGVQPAVTQ
jgi:hypothetical protein